MENLGRIEITVYPDILRNPPALNAGQRDLVRRLVAAVLDRQFSRVALRHTLEAELYHAARQVGPEAVAQFEDLLKGIQISIRKPEEEQKDDPLPAEDPGLHRSQP